MPSLASPLAVRAARFARAVGEEPVLSTISVDGRTTGSPAVEAGHRRPSRFSDADRWLADPAGPVDSDVDSPTGKPSARPGVPVHELAPT